MRQLVCLIGLSMSFATLANSQQATMDSDHDGLSDIEETALLEQFAPAFFISSHDCSAKAAEFQPMQKNPTVVAENGTIYGQAKVRKGNPQTVELHFYHLWRTDCGEMGHPLDAEHVSALVHSVDTSGRGPWQAVYWYAAAHEDTLCDASQVTRAATLEAVNHGPRVWISAGKHASFLKEGLCRSGCGGDRCVDSKALTVAAIVNLGEAGHPASGADWISSPQWPLLLKMTRTDFPGNRTARLDALPTTAVAWANPSRRPAQAAVLGGNCAIAGVITGAASSGDALTLTRQETGEALSAAEKKTGIALSRSLHSVRHGLGTAARHTESAVGVTGDKQQ